MPNITVSFSLDTERDTDLIAWIEKHGRRTRSAAIREKLRASISQSGVSLADILQEVREVKRLLRSGVVVTGEGADIGPTEDNPEAEAIKGKLTVLGR